MERPTVYVLERGLSSVKIDEVTVSLWPAGTLDDGEPYIELLGGEDREGRMTILVPVSCARALAEVIGVFANAAEGLSSPVVSSLVTSERVPVVVWSSGLA